MKIELLFDINPKEWAVFLNTAFPCYTCWIESPVDIRPSVTIFNSALEYETSPILQLVADHVFYFSYFNRIITKPHRTRVKHFLPWIHEYSEVFIPIESLSIQQFRTKLLKQFGLSNEKYRCRIYVGKIKAGSERCFETNFLVNLEKTVFTGIPITVKSIIINNIEYATNINNS